MNLSVSARIIFGFSVLVILSIVMSTVSILSLNNIGQGVERITHNSVPSLISGSNLAQSLLEAELSLKQLAATNTQESAASERLNFSQAKSQNLAAIEDLHSLLETENDLTVLFRETKQINDDFFSKLKKPLRRILTF